MVRHIIHAFALTALVSALGIAGARAHEGHDHGPQAPAAPATVARAARPIRKGSRLSPWREGKTLAIYLDDYKTNAPVDGAEVEVETPSGRRRPSRSATASIVSMRRFSKRAGIST